VNHTTPRSPLTPHHPTPADARPMPADGARRRGDAGDEDEGQAAGNGAARQEPQQVPCAWLGMKTVSILVLMASICFAAGMFIGDQRSSIYYEHHIKNLEFLTTSCLTGVLDIQKEIDETMAEVIPLYKNVTQKADEPEITILRKLATVALLARVTAAKPVSDSGKWMLSLDWSRVAVHSEMLKKVHEAVNAAAEAEQNFVKVNREMNPKMNSTAKAE